MRGERLHCVRQMRRDQGAETMHQTAMCCTDADWTGLHTNTYLLTFKHTFEQSHITALQSKSRQDKANEDRLVKKVESGLFYLL